jgi:ubiquinone/menaquinone biosynthesis C-methylase UbiE
MSQIAFNTKAHDQLARRYERLHTEIYNDIEQTRLKQALYAAVDAISSNSTPKTALDFGCGAGNLTGHLHDLGVRVTAADISTAFLQLITERYPDVTTHRLNGADLSEIPNATFDLVATYSVLHHIPDYLHAVTEMCRVLKPGGVLYIDHEKNQAYWDNEPRLHDFYTKQKSYIFPHKLKRLFSPMWYIHRLRRIKNPRYQAEGDIHVWPDDHVDWSQVIAIAVSSGLRIEQDYNFLLYDSRYNIDVYDAYKNDVTDTRAIIMKKYV